MHSNSDGPVCVSKGAELNFSSQDLMAFIGLNIAMGMLHLPQIKDYWSTSQILCTPWFPSIMSRDQFITILRYLHLVDSSVPAPKKGEQGYDPLFKVRFLVDHLAAVYPQYYYPARHLSIDEMMVGTRCRVAFLQYLPKKTYEIWYKDLDKFWSQNWICSELWNIHRQGNRKRKGIRISSGDGFDEAVLF